MTKDSNLQGSSAQRLRLPLLALLLALAFAACHNDGLSKEQRRARQAAERCYKYLQDGEYNRFVDEIAYADQMSPEYRAQMLDLIHEHTEHNRLAHGELLSAVATGDTLMGDLAHVYLQLTYADSTSEEVGLPMVCIEGDWKMQ